jgi:hypothetical protein
MMAKTTTTTIKTPPVSEPDEQPPLNRYGRASAILIKLGADLDVDLLAKKAELSVSAARYCREAHIGVCAALTQAGLLKAEPVPVEKPETATGK